MSAHDHDLLPVLERLGAEVERVAYAAEAGAGTDAARTPRRRRRAHVPRALVIALAALVPTAAVVAAATGLLSTGAPVTDPKGVGFGDAKSGWGVPIAKTIKLAPLRVGDPDGGPPWGIRTFRTTRGVGCVQIGRVQGDQLGVIGQDGAFDNDNKFHPMGPTVMTGAFCTPVDGAGHAFLAVVRDGLPSAALDRGCAVQPNDRLPTCALGHQRIVFYGVLGPEAEAITYRAPDGSVATQRVTGPEGAYLVVQRPTREHPADGSFQYSQTPATRLLSVRYRDGSVCRMISPIRFNGARRCPAKGYVPPAGRRLTSADVAAPVKATVSSRPVSQRLPGMAAPPKNTKIPDAWRVTVRFRARVATRGQANAYVFSIVPRTQKRCKLGGMGGMVNHDVQAGDAVAERVFVPADCRGRLDVLVALRQPSGTKADPVPAPLLPGNPGKLPVVGRTSVDIP
jgi:hypothetical protein